MELFPGVALCFATFRDKLNPSEKCRLRAITNAGRERLSPGHQRNPVIILTGKELFGQYKLGDFYGEYGTDERWIRRWRGLPASTPAMSSANCFKSVASRLR